MISQQRFTSNHWTAFLRSSLRLIGSESKGKIDLAQPLDDFLARGASIFDHAERVLMDTSANMGEALMVERNMADYIKDLYGGRYEGLIKKSPHFQ